MAHQICQSASLRHINQINTDLRVSTMNLNTFTVHYTHLRAQVMRHSTNFFWLPSIDPDIATKLDKPLTLRNSMMSMQNRKSQGHNSFPAEFKKKKTILDSLSPLLHNMLQTICKQASPPTPRLRQATIKIKIHCLVAIIVLLTLCRCQISC